MCTWRVTQEPPNERHGKGELHNLQPPKTGLLSPWHGSASSMGLKVCPHPVYTHSKATQSLAAEGRGGEGTPPSATALAELSGDWGTWGHGWQLLIALTARVGAQSRDTVPTHIHQDPSGHGPRGIPVPLPHSQGAGWAARQGTLHPTQGQDVPKSGTKAAGRGFINSILRSFGLFIYPAANSLCCINPHLEIIQRNPPAQPSPRARAQTLCPVELQPQLIPSAATGSMETWILRESCPKMLLLPRTYIARCLHPSEIR